MLHGSQSITRGTLQCSAAEIDYKTQILMQPFLDLEFVLIKPTIKLAFAGLLTATVQALFTCLSNTKRTRQGEPREVPQSHQHSRELAGHIILDKEAWSNWGR